MNNIERMFYQRLSRRKLLLTAAAGGAGLYLSGCGIGGKTKEPTPTAPPPPGKTPEKGKPTALIPTDYLMSFGDEYAISLRDQNIRWTPDLHTPYIALIYADAKEGRRYFISGNAASYRLDIQGTLYEMRASLEDVEAPLSHGHDEKFPYRNGYSAIGAVLQVDKRTPEHLWGFTHNEYREHGFGVSFDDDKFTASVGLIESKDGGESWQDYGPVISGDDPLQPGIRATGAGQPSAIIKGKYGYVYYIDWASGKKVQHPDQIYLGRLEIKNGKLGQVEHYTKNGFSKPGAPPENLQPVITVPDIPDATYAALPSVSYNTYLKEYLCVFETNVGFCATRSRDGIKWRDAGLIAKFPAPHSALKYNSIWYSYPSLVSDQSQPNDQVTDREAVLYCARKSSMASAHGMVAIPVRLK